MSSFSQFTGGAPKSIQTGSIAITAGSGTGTISAVDTSKSVIYHSGSYHSTTSQSGNGAMSFASSTSISAIWNGTGGVIRYTVVESY